MEKVIKVNARKQGFPTFALVLLTIGVIWLLNDLELISIDIPWVPVVLILVAIGMIYNRYFNPG